jgi:hypothetical protein
LCVFEWREEYLHKEEAERAESVKLELKCGLMLKNFGNNGGALAGSKLDTRIGALAEA